MMNKWNQNSADDWRTNHWNASTSELASLYGEQKDALHNVFFAPFMGIIFKWFFNAFWVGD